MTLIKLVCVQCVKCLVCDEDGRGTDETGNECIGSKNGSTKKNNKTKDGKSIKCSRRKKSMSWLSSSSLLCWLRLRGRQKGSHRSKCTNKFDKNKCMKWIISRRWKKNADKCSAHGTKETQWNIDSTIIRLNELVYSFTRSPLVWTQKRNCFKSKTLAENM